MMVSGMLPKHSLPTRPVSYTHLDVYKRQELERVFFGYVDGIEILYPKTLVELMSRKLEKAAKQYTKSK